MNYKRLIGIATAVTTIGAYTFSFNSFQSQDSLIKQGIDRLKGVVNRYKNDLATLQAEYNTLLGDLNSTQDALQQARLKLQAIYQKITGQEWTEANGDILNFDFDTLLKDSDQYDNNVDGNAIAEILGLPAGASTEEIIVAIQDLIATVQSLEARIVQLEGQVDALEAEIAEYEEEQTSLVEEINGLKDKLDEATAEANAIIDGASQEEKEQLDYINDTLEELGEETINAPLNEEQQTALDNYHAAVTANSWNEEYSAGFISGDYYPEVSGSSFFVKSSADGSIIKQYDTVSDAMKAINTAYQAYLATL